jgi:hypothetical protein
MREKAQISNFQISNINVKALDMIISTINLAVNYFSEI